MLRFTDHIFVNLLVCSWVTLFVFLLPSSSYSYNLSAGMMLKTCFWSSALLLLFLSVYLFVSALYSCVCLYVCLCTVRCPLSCWKNHCQQKREKKNRKITWRFHISHREFDNYNLEVSGKKSNCCIKRCIKLDGFCKSLHKIGFVWNEAVWLVIPVILITLPPMHACWMAVTGWFFRAPPSLSLLSTLCFFPFLFLSPLFPARPPIDPPAPFTCLLSFSSGGERANKQNQQTAFLVHTCGYVFMFSQVGNN